MATRVGTNTRFFDLAAKGERVDLTMEGTEARIPYHTTTFCLRCGCTSHISHASVLTKTVKGVPDAKVSRLYSIVVICQ